MKKNYDIKRCGEFYRFWLDRIQILNKFDFSTDLHHIPESQMDIQTLLTDEFLCKKIWQNEIYVQKLVTYCKHSMKLALTKKPENIEMINKEYDINEADTQWCETTIRSLILKIADIHLPYLFGILMGRFTYINAMKYTKEHTIILKVKYHTGEIKNIHAPKFAAPLSVIKHFIEKYNIATQRDKQSIIDNQMFYKSNITKKCKNELKHFKYVDFDILKKIGYQSYEEAHVWIESCFKSYKFELWQLLSEKEDGKPLLHTDQMENLLKNELSTPMINAYMANQVAKYVSTKGSMVCELLNSYLESFLRCKRIKSSKISWMELILQFVKWNIHVMNKYLNGEYRYHERFTDWQMHQMKQLVNEVTHTNYIHLEYYSNGNYYHIDNSSQKWVVEQATDWFTDCQLKPNKPYWDRHCSNELKVWVTENTKYKSLSYVHCHMIEDFFHHLWDFEYICQRAKKIGIKVIPKPKCKAIHSKKGT